MGRIASPLKYLWIVIINWRCLSFFYTVFFLPPLLSGSKTRSADEPMTTFVYCNHCGHRWKFC
ncbi:hypothetical protein AHF37_08903 [Paragonimus kellicotti]|nr:hypothetical protein AHF37_08903 [Paragonimus kellicotti]